MHACTGGSSWHSGQGDKGCAICSKGALRSNVQTLTERDCTQKCFPMRSPQIISKHRLFLLLLAYVSCLFCPRGEVMKALLN
jgi:hypothetical protein